ncbi:hypothetical protein HY409_02200 [Candidatus Gottesmanbacteria bacterium]|nr:hypothetical protein [Candidatus Gottesmanbacteria bacterium]
MKKIIVILVTLILLAAIPITLYVLNQKQELRKKAAPATTLLLAPSTFTKKIGDEFTVEIKINTGENQVLTTELHLTFDATKLQAISIVNGPLFPNVLSSGVVESGAASITVGAANSTSPVTSSGTVATLRMKALEKTDAPVSIRFAATTFVGALKESSKNVLIGTTPATVTITEDSTQETVTDRASLQNKGLSNFSSFTPISSTSSDEKDTPEASISAVTILSESLDNKVSDPKPVIKGKAPPGSTVTVTFYSTPVTCIAVADENGDYSCSPDTPLEEGPHDVVVSAAASDGTNLTTSSTIVVDASGTNSATSSPLPTSGNTEMTLLMLVLAMLLITSGIVIPIVTR